VSAHERDIAEQLIALAPLLHADWYHCHHALRLALFEAAVGLAEPSPARAGRVLVT